MAQKPGYQYDIFDTMIDNKTEEYKKAREKLSKDLREEENTEIDERDWMVAKEHEQDLDDLKRQIKHLDDYYNQDIAALNAQKNPKTK